MLPTRRFKTHRSKQTLQCKQTFEPSQIRGSTLNNIQLFNINHYFDVYCQTIYQRLDNYNERNDHSIVSIKTILSLDFVFTARSFVRIKFQSFFIIMEITRKLQHFQVFQRLSGRIRLEKPQKLFYERYCVVQLYANYRKRYFWPIIESHLDTPTFFP